MSCLNNPVSMWYLTGDNSGYSDKFLPAINGLSKHQEMNGLTHSVTGKDFNYTTEAYIDIEPKNGAYIAFGEFSGVNPPDSALQIKQYIKSTLTPNRWMVRLG